jgi:hypothetical protein
VTGNISVQSGITLTIGAGDRILFSGPYSLGVGGTLIAQGTATKRIRFTSHQSNPQGWIGVYLLGLSASTISFADIEDAGAVSGGGGKVLWVENGAHTIDNVIIQSNVCGHSLSFPDGCLVLGAGNNTVQNSILRYNQGNVVDVTGGNEGMTRFLSNTVTANGLGPFTLKAAKARTILQGNYFVDNYAMRSVVIAEGGYTEITGNSFLTNTTDSGVVQISRSGSTFIFCNLFMGNEATGSPSYPGEVIGIRSPGSVAIGRNNILPGLSDYAVAVDSGTRPVDATNNYWGTTDASNIAQRIYDFFDDSTLPEVTFDPYLTAPSACAPPPP